MERKSLYSVVNILLPVVLMSLIDLLVFILPPESGEKISLGITVLLAYSVFMLVISETLPRNSDSTPIMSKYISVLLSR